MASIRSFARDIRPLFRDSDVEEMQFQASLDLSKYEVVKSRSADIYERLSDKTMPCDGGWPDGQIALFKLWMDEGMAP